MASKILSTFETIVKPVIHFISLANGAGSSTDTVDNTTTRASMCMVFLRIKTADHAPTANAPVKLYLVRHSNDGTAISDNAISATHSAAGGIAAEPTQAECLGSIILGTGTATVYEKSFLAYDLSPKYSFVVWNACGTHLSDTEADSELQVLPVTPEGQ